jgi:hypothetical protein
MKKDKNQDYRFKNKRKKVNDPHIISGENSIKGFKSPEKNKFNDSGTKNLGDY